MKLSTAIITLNEENNLRRTLPTIVDLVDEIVIVDSGSTDKTKEVAESFGAIFIFNKWEGYGEQRNFAFNNCHGEWILCIDADEALTSELCVKIEKIINSVHQKKIFAINRKSICFGKLFNYGTFGKSFAVRLFQKGIGKFSNNVVHEKFISHEKVYKLPKKYHILHYSYDTMEDYFDRFNSYTTKAAIDLESRDKKSSTFKIIFAPFFTFLKIYFLKLGFLDGLEGFVLSLTNAMYPMVKYFKLMERERQKK